jgi:hypothetical protein
VNLTFVVSQLFPVAVMFAVALIPVQTTSLNPSLTLIGSQSFVHSVDQIETAVVECICNVPKITSLPLFGRICGNGES